MIFQLQAHASFLDKGVPFGVLEATFPQQETWDLSAFEALKAQELERLRERFAAYDRKVVFGENPYYRYFKRYKKTYPVLQQLESFLLKGRPFPSGNPINEVAFLTELQTQMLVGAHDIDRFVGVPELFCPAEKLPYLGMRGEEVHTYPGDISGRDSEGIIWGMIAGADERTHLRPESRHVAYLVFGAPDVTREQVDGLLSALADYAAILAPAVTVRKILI